MNKPLITLGVFLLIWALSLFSAWGQQAPPADCAQTQGTVLPWQDCQGAKWITQAETIIQSSDVTGPGCQANELPAASQTCLITNERRTVWLMFEVQPLPGGPTAIGSPAGQLRFKIVPADVDAQALSDDGQDMLGMTDYDFALFDVTGKADRTNACAAIKAATAVGTPGSVQVACNYSGYPGPTGLSTMGVGYSVDNQRYDAPLAVSVGQVFLLAVDNYSLNASYFRLTFESNDSTTVLPAARIVPEVGQPSSSAALHTNVGCGYGMEVAYPLPVSIDSLRTDAFLLTYKGRLLRPRAITCTDADGLRSQGTRFTLLFAERLDTGVFQLEQTARLADRYGREQLTFTRLQSLQLPVRIRSESLKLCSGSDFRAQVSGPASFGYGGWSASAGFGPGVGTLNAFALLASTRPAAGTYTLTYRFLWPEGCPDSVSIKVEVVAVPDAPTLLPAPNGGLQASLAANATAEWAGPDSTFTGPALLTPSKPGIYRVRQISDGCPTGWSNPVALGLTQVRRAGDVETSIYPNPAHETAHIRVKGAQGNRLEIEMLASDGTSVSHVTYHDSVWERSISLAGIPPGLYTLRITTETSMTSHRLLVR